MKDVSIIIVNYNTAELTLNCLSSIYKFTEDIDFEIILIDNASTDGSVELIKKNHPDVILIESKINIGFGKANNLGVKYAKGNYLFLLNSDTLLIENSIKYLFDFYCKNKQLDIGVLGCLLIDENHIINGFGSQIPTIKEFFKMRINKIPFINLNINQQNNYNIEDKIFFNIDYVIGADMFLTRNLFNQIGGFDPNYFMYYEESDFQIKILNGGLKNYIVTGTKIIHLEGKSFNNNVVSNFKRIIVHSSELYFIKKNYNRYYSAFKILDTLVLFMNIFNFKYSFKENIYYIKTILKSQ